MMNNSVHFISFLLVLMCSPLMGCAQTLPDNIDISVSPTGVVDMPANVPAAFTNGGFVKYTKIQCPNGEAIHFVAQNQVTEAQIIRARTLLEFYLKNVPGSQYGADKTNVKNTMGTNDALLLLMNGSDNGQNDPTVNGQPLYYEEMAVEGHQWYTSNDFNHRDASFEEILHMMHDMGIGVDGTNSISNPALPAYQQEIRAAQLNAAQNNFAIWPLGAGGSNAGIQQWYNELSNENSLTQEYLASIIDSYYGLWEPWTDDPTTGMWGIYIAHNRAEIQTEDPMGWALLPKFFSPVIDVDMIIDPTFNGVFKMSVDNNIPYTHKSQYLQHAYLWESNNSGLQGNDLYNRLKGNNGNNSFEGLKGNDRLDGWAGEDTAKFTGPMADYTITNLTTYATVADGVSGRDGVDTLWNMEFLQFSDQAVPITLTSTVGVVELNDDTDFQAVVTGNSEWLTIKSSINREIKIYATSGELITSVRMNGEVQELDISSWKSGMYLVIEEGVRTRKIVVSR